MDWPRARAILLAAFTVVNIVFAYALWGPSGITFGSTEASHEAQVDSLRKTLASRGVYLSTAVAIPKTPSPMRFLHVQHRMTPEFPQWLAEFSGRGSTQPSGTPMVEGPAEHLNPTIDPETQAIIFRPEARGLAAREMRLESRIHVQQTVDEYLKQVSLLPQQSMFIGRGRLTPNGTMILLYAPTYEGYPVFSGYLQVEVSPRGVERMSQYWVQPTDYTQASPKAVRPAAEALLRLAGRLQQDQSTGRRVITDVSLGYYAGRSLASSPEGINGWDTVPVWRISLDGGQVYYINAFNGEWET
jgi:hypothetical protein